MVAARLLDLRKLDFSLSPSRAHPTMASLAVADVSLQPPMMKSEENTISLHDYVQLGTAGAIVVQVAVIVATIMCKCIHMFILHACLYGIVHAYMACSLSDAALCMGMFDTIYLHN